MSDENQLVLTEELLTEFLDPVTAKAYTYQIETDYPATCKFQASFEDEHEKRYYLSFYRDPSLGKTARKVIFSVKKNKNLNPKINVDKGSFIKILGTIIQIYQYYKENDSDGKMSNSYGFQFPDTFAKYMPFVHKVIKRLFKTTPKIRLELFGAVDSLDNATIMYYVNASSHMPHFGGPKADLSVIRGPFYTSLTGETAASVSADTKADLTTTPGAAPYVPEPYKVPPEIANFKLDVKPKPAAKTVKKAKVVEPIAPIEIVKAVDPVEPSSTDNGMVHPDITNGDIGTKPSFNQPNRIKMLVNSGSSSLPQGKEAVVYGAYKLSTFKQIYSQFKIPENVASKVGGPLVLVVTPLGKADKFVALSVTASQLNDSNSSFEYFDFNKGMYPKPVVPEKPKVDFNYVPKNDSAKTFEIPESFTKALKEIEPVNFGPVKIGFGDDVSIIGVADKLNEVKKFFGKLPENELQSVVSDMINKIDGVQKKLSASINKFLSENNLHYGSGGATPESINAVTMYTGSGYGSINAYLRTGEADSSSNIVLRVAQIDAGFAAEGIRFPKDLNVYRGASISEDQINMLKKFSIIPLTGYASVSLRAHIANSFASVGGYSSEMVKGALITFDDDENRKDLPSAEVQSKQGNKIIYSINRLDRCLAIAVKNISQHSHEEEIILNRGTHIKLRPGAKLQKVMNRYNPYGENVGKDDGLWIAKVEIAPNAVSESSLRSFLLREAVNKFSEAQDAVAFTAFFLEDCLETVSK
jgi:hypothetical protein